MANELTPIKQISNLMNGSAVKAKFTEMLGKRAPQFISSVMSAVSANPLLSKATPASVYGAAMMAATLDLPVNGSLGFAYLVPFNSKKKNPATGKDEYINEAQFQIGAKGFIQLAIRSGMYSRIEVHEVYEGEVKVANKFKGDYIFGEKTSDKIVGYMGYFRLHENYGGYEQYLYMSVEELQAHGQRYSKTYKFGVWNSNFDAMAKKTVIKRLLSKSGILSVEMQRAKVFDQGIVNREEDEVQDIEDAEIIYADNEKPSLADLAEMAEKAEEKK